MSLDGVLKRKITPWLMFLFGFMILDTFPVIVGGMCMLMGFVILLDRLFPEKWDNNCENKK